MSEKHINLQTIKNFGEQWQYFQKNEGYYASQQLFDDICGKLVTSAEISGMYVADIGSGTGRIVQMLINSGADKVVAIEPSEEAFSILKKNTLRYANKIEYLNVTGEEIPASLELDYIFSIGVIHHISNPQNTINAAYSTLKQGGKIVIWVYGYEGNTTYLRIFTPLRKLTTKLPHIFLSSLSHTLNFILSFYIVLCKFFTLPLKQYINNVSAKMSRYARYLIIYDQLNPAYAKYYRKHEVKELLENAGFKHVKLHHRHRYSWTAIGQK